MARKQKVRVGLVALSVALASGALPALSQTTDDPLIEALKDPPQSSRPRVWWHWMNGNITEEGIAKDIEWMKRVGIGGLQNFDASLLTPQVVEKRLVYMTPEWKKAFRFAAERADAEGLELAIAASPGWSETGGPWVKPEDGIKKLSWSQIDVPGGRRFNGRLAEPPHTTGPYQTIVSENMLGLEQGTKKSVEVYRDIAVLAIPVAPEAAAPKAIARGGDGRELDLALLEDGELSKVIDLGAGDATAPPSMSLSYAAPRAVRSATLYVPDGKSQFGTIRFTPRLEARGAAGWETVGEFELSNVPTTISFAPVRASEFRLVFNPYSGPKRPAVLAPAPGAIILPVLMPETKPGPAKVAEFRLDGETRVDRFEAKAAFSLVNDYYGLQSSASPVDAGAPKAKILDLTARLKADGTLDWTPPAGKWRILRLGWTLTGKINHPAPPEATGLEVDKLDADAVERYLRHYLDMYKDAAGSDMIGAKGVRALLTDSTEVGAFNWTPRFAEHFRKMRGYDPLPWLPTLTGMVVGTRAESDRFLYDFRRTLAELHATQHYQTVARVAHEHGLTMYGEALEDMRPAIGDDIAMRRYTDIPMGAMWVWNDDMGVRPTLLGDLKGASSTGHFYGQNIIGAESMTSALRPWGAAPSDLRRVIDLIFVNGVNRPMIHTSVHQPIDNKKPGLSLMIFGQFFNRHDSWADMARPWVDYIARSSYLLQQGRNVADVAYFYGEEAPITALTAYGPLADTPTRHAYDFVNSDGVTQGLTVDGEGRLVAPSGATYRALYLGGSSRKLTVHTLCRLAALAEEGATIIGKRPEASPSLADSATDFAAAVKTLWSGAPETRVGKGRVFASDNIEDALGKAGVVADADFGPAASDINFVHRSLPDGDLYFVVNRSKNRLNLDARFRVKGKAPELVRADNATATPLSYRQDGAVTVVPLELGPNDSQFILFRKPTTQTSQDVAAVVLRPVAELGGTWDVSFQPERGAPAGARMAQLASLTDSGDPGVRYFSGEATYSKSFRLPSGTKAGGPLWLDLGSVGDLAEVTVNGSKLGTVWHAPFRIDIGGAVRPGENKLEVRVANLWVNRLIGDAQPGAEKVTFVTIPTYSADAPLRPSGLIGPVRLLAPE